jgi:RHS repeat-associated protein
MRLDTKLEFVIRENFFNGQTLDSTGLYYYNARYYDPTIGRFKKYKGGRQ